MIDPETLPWWGWRLRLDSGGWPCLFSPRGRCRGFTARRGLGSRLDYTGPARPAGSYTTRGWSNDN